MDNFKEKQKHLASEWMGIEPEISYKLQAIHSTCRQTRILLISTNEWHEVVPRHSLVSDRQSRTCNEETRFHGIVIEWKTDYNNKRTSRSMKKRMHESPPKRKFSELNAMHTHILRVAHEQRSKTRCCNVKNEFFDVSNISRSTHRSQSPSQRKVLSRARRFWAPP